MAPLTRCLKASPNAAHHAIAALARADVRARLMPSSAQAPLVITQNFDGLSVRALAALDLPEEDAAIAKERLIEMHGSAYYTICTECKKRNYTSDTPLSPALAGYTADNYHSCDIPLADLPRCGGSNYNGGNRFGACGGLLRPGIVWFGEAPYSQGEIARVINWADLLIVVGTSSLVSACRHHVKGSSDRLEGLPSSELCKDRARPRGQSRLLQFGGSKRRRRQTGLYVPRPV